jgi:hypothetical protein
MVAETSLLRITITSAVDGDGNVIVTEEGSHDQIRELSPDGTVESWRFSSGVVGFGGAIVGASHRVKQFKGVAINADWCVVANQSDDTVAKVTGRTLTPRCEKIVEEEWFDGLSSGSGLQSVGCIKSVDLDQKKVEVVVVQGHEVLLSQTTPKVGQLVRLALGYAVVGDSCLGPLQPGQLATILQSKMTA